MDPLDILDEVTQIFRNVLGQDQLTLSWNTTAKDVRGWDSLNHALLLSEVQKHFQIRFTVNEVLGMENVGQLCTTVKAKLPNSN